LGMFRRRGYNITVYVKVETQPPNALVDLLKAVLDVFPQCDDLWRRHRETYTPHLTIAQFQSEEEYSKALPELEKMWIPVKFVLKELYFITRPRKREPFEVRQVVPLGKPVSPPLVGPGCPVTEKKLHNSLVVVGIPRETTEQQVTCLFSSLSHVLSVRVLPNTDDRDWCCATVEFSSFQEMQSVLSRYDALAKKPFPNFNMYLRPLNYVLIHVNEWETGC